MTGTYENEDLAVNFLKRRIVNIQSRASDKQNVNMDHQIATGSYILQFKPYAMLTSYRKVQNIVVRLEGDTPNALMINCHFDTVPGRFVETVAARDDSSSISTCREMKLKINLY